MTSEESTPSARRAPINIFPQEMTCPIESSIPPPPPKKRERREKKISLARFAWKKEGRGEGGEGEGTTDR